MNVILFQGEKVIGAFDSYEICCDFIKSVENLGWATNFKVLKFKSNSCIKEWEKSVTFKIKEEVNDENISIKNEDDNAIDSSSNYITSEKSNPKIKKKEARKKQDEQYKINLLQKQREKIIESKNKYEVDKKLYDDFKKKKEEGEFEIPEIFSDKYEIFSRLDKENNLSWDTFATEYKEKDFNGRFSSIFDVSNEFDQKFCMNVNVESSDSSDDESNTESEIEETSDYNESSGDDDEVIEVFSSDGSN